MELTRKIVLLGQFGVGKTSLTRRYLLDIFETDYLPTLGVQIKKKTVILPSGKELSMIIWDLEGFNSVSATRTSYLLGSNAFIYVFDITRPITYIGISEDLKYIEKNYPKVHLMVVGNKKDLVEPEYLENTQQLKDIPTDEFVSAKTGDGVHELFNQLVKKLVP
ncbi:MAG: GTP-binding protein [Flavobacteriaceae bacterium]|nr:GTP-binding protein [Flavobacteriaceae bacterium]